jgi:hypothetical protein
MLPKMSLGRLVMSKNLHDHCCEHGNFTSERLASVVPFLRNDSGRTGDREAPEPLG